MTTFKTDYVQWGRVYIDGDKTIVARVLSFQFFDPLLPPNVEVSWVHNGALATAWVGERRLSPAEDDK